MSKRAQGWKKGLVGITCGSILAFSSSGCSNIIRNALISKEVQVDMSKSIFKDDYKKKADEIMETARTNRTARAMNDVRTAVELYEKIKDYDKMIEAARFYFNYDPFMGNRLLQGCQEKLNEAKKK